MRYKTVGEIITFSKQLHEALSHQYAELEQLTTSDRAALILDYFNRHEQQLAAVLANYDSKTKASVLNTWIQNAPELDVESLTNAVREVDLNDVGSIVKAAMNIDSFLVKLYTNLRENAEIESVREIFDSLVSLECAESVRNGRSAANIMDF